MAERARLEIESVLKDWLELVKKKVLQAIYHIDTNALPKAKQVLKDPFAQEELANLQSKYVIVPADKAPNNVIFICKKYYYQILV